MFLYQLFLDHPYRQGVTYLSHLRFAMGIALRLGHSFIAFTLHAIIPIIDIPKSQDLEAMCKFLEEQNTWIENQKPSGHLSYQSIANK